MKIIDLTHTLDNATLVYPGDVVVSLVKSEDRESGTIITHHALTAGGHAGTHMDGPAHMIPGGKNLFEIDPAKFLGRGVMIDIRGDKEITADFFEKVEVLPGDCICLCTGLSVHFNDPEYFSFIPAISVGFAQGLVDRGVHMLVVDCASPDTPPFPIHKILLGGEVLLVENACNMEELLGKEDIEIIALPTKLRADSAQVRIIARI